MKRRRLAAISLVAFLIPASDLSARVWIVAADGSGDFTKISEVCAAAASGDTIAIEPGNYTEEEYNDCYHGRILVTEKSLCFLGMGMRPGDVSLSLNLGFIRCNGVTVEKIRFYNTCGPIGIWAGDYTFRNCSFEDNQRSPNGGGGGAIGAWYTPSVLVEDCYFARNSCFGDLWAGRGGAIYMEECCLTVRRCVFVGNSSTGVGGAIWSYVTPIIEECVFYQNEAEFGAGVAIGYHATLRNCTFWRNRTHGWGGAVCIEEGGYSNPDHCIIAGTIDGYGMTCWGGTNPVCCDFWENDRGAVDELCVLDQDRGNFSADPMFCDPESGDFGLREGSPCLPGNHGGYECDLIGARGLGCGMDPTRKVTWGQLRALYR